VRIARWFGPICSNLRLLLPILLSLALSAGASAQLKPRFSASTLAGAGSELLLCDLDGDGRKDLVLMEDLALAIFYQDAQGSFPHEPQRVYHLEPRPCVVWTAKLGGPAESVLVMTSDGVSELSFAARTGPPTVRQIIHQPTFVPAEAEGTNAFVFPLSVQTGSHSPAGPLATNRPAAVSTGSDWPLLLVPTSSGLQVWQHREDWRQEQRLSDALDAELWPSVANPGYSTFLQVNLSVGDVNGDGREDVMVKRSPLGPTNFYRLYLQQTNGLLAQEPAMTYADKTEPFSWLCWADLNHDGRVDLLKSVWLNEPSFLPSIPSGKVLVNTYLADAQGRIPSAAHQVFRKNDWLAALPVVDVDGDGYLDLVLGYGRMDSREGVRKQITARQLDYTLRFFFYRPGVGFPNEADCQRNVVIRLDSAEFPLDWKLPQNFLRRVKVGGDFTGQGKPALLVRDRSEDISVYYFISRQQGFSTEPDLRFSCPEPIWEWQVADLNNDGISDLIVTLENQAGFRVFVSQK
jgi:hypothetical protein